MNEKLITLIPLTSRQVYEDQMSIQKNIDIKKSESTKEREIERKKNEKVKKNETIVERSKKQQVNLFTREDEVKRAFYSKHPLIVLLHKEACLSTNELKYSLPSAIVTLLHDFDYLFPNGVLNDLPPIRDIKHQIDFFLELPYLINQHIKAKETNEFYRQVEELLAKRYVRESMSPCAVLVVLVPKKDGTWRM